MSRYKKLWVDPEGLDYRMKAFNRQKTDGTKPLIDNPTFDEIKRTILRYEPRSVLEIGCGWGRILEQLKDEPYELWGCDVSQDMLDHVPGGLKVFPMDIASSSLNGFTRWDVTFSRGVLHYLLDDPQLIDLAVSNIEMFTLVKCIVWERAHVCDAIARLTKHVDLFDFKPVEIREE